MLGLARFAMGGRFRALLLAVISSGSLVIAWVGAAVVALVTLRRGYAEGLWLLLWAALPAVLITSATGDAMSLALLLGTTFLALVLRASVSLTLTAELGTVVAVVTGLALVWFGQAFLTQLTESFGEVLMTLERQALEAGGRPLTIVAPTERQLAGVIGTSVGTLSFLCVALARYWQAALYNPGGFGAEFRALRLPPVVAVGCVAVAVLLAMQGVVYSSWGAAFLLPPTVAGFALLHARAKERGQSGFWLGGVYVVWAVFDAAKLALVALVVADVLVDFRRRWGTSTHNPGSPGQRGDADDSDSAPDSDDDTDGAEK